MTSAHRVLDRRSKILIVEEEFIARQLCGTLTRLGYPVVGIAASGVEALKLVEEATPDLILTGIRLKGKLDGFDFAEQVRKIWTIPSIFLLADAHPDVLRRTENGDLNGYLRPPFTDQELQSTIETALRNRGWEEQQQSFLQRSREELREMAANLFSEREDERQRIARDLHDDIVQRLALVQIEIESLWKQFHQQQTSKIDHQFQTIQKRVADLIADLRDVCYQLHPSVLDDLGLPIAMTQLTEEFKEKYKIPIFVSMRKLPQEIPLAIAIPLYRILQEALQNIAKHSGERATVDISLTGGRNCLYLSIHDTGKGFDVTAPKNRMGLGLVSMAQRVELCGGIFELWSEPGEGTQIHVRVPLPV